LFPVFLFLDFLRKCHYEFILIKMYILLANRSSFFIFMFVSTSTDSLSIFSPLFESQTFYIYFSFFWSPFKCIMCSFFFFFIVGTDVLLEYLCQVWPILLPCVATFLSLAPTHLVQVELIGVTTKLCRTMTLHEPIGDPWSFVFTL